MVAIVSFIFGFLHPNYIIKLHLNILKDKPKLNKRYSCLMEVHAGRFLIAYAQLYVRLKQMYIQKWCHEYLVRGEILF